MGKYYVVKKGRKTGIFTSWDETKSYVHGYSGAIYKSFKNYDNAVLFLGGGQNSLNKCSINENIKDDTRQNSLNKCSTIENTKDDIGQNSLNKCSTIENTKDDIGQNSLNNCSTIENTVSHILKTHTIDCYTDGGSRKIAGKQIAGIGVYIPLLNISISKRVPDGMKQSNNVAELMALMKCFKIIKKTRNCFSKGTHNEQLSNFIIYSDSEYSINSILGIYNGKKNRDIIDYCRIKYSEIKSFTLMEHVYAHTGVEGNEIADQLATRAILDF